MGLKETFKKFSKNLKEQKKKYEMNKEKKEKYQLKRLEYETNLYSKKAKLENAKAKYNKAKSISTPKNSGFSMGLQDNNSVFGSVSIGENNKKDKKKDVLYFG